MHGCNDHLRGRGARVRTAQGWPTRRPWSAARRDCTISQRLDDQRSRADGELSGRQRIHLLGVVVEAERVVVLAGRSEPGDGEVVVDAFALLQPRPLRLAEVSREPVRAVRALALGIPFKVSNRLGASARVRLAGSRLQRRSESVLGDQKVNEEINSIAPARPALFCCPPEGLVLRAFVLKR